MSAPSVAVNSVELLHFLVGSFSSRGTFVTVLYELTAGGDELFVCDVSAIETKLSLVEAAKENSDLTVEGEIGEFYVTD